MSFDVHKSLGFGNGSAAWQLQMNTEHLQATRASSVQASLMIILHFVS